MLHSCGNILFDVDFFSAHLLFLLKEEPNPSPTDFKFSAISYALTTKFRHTS